ncbi:LysR family transcriptional regulator [Lentibacillus saliphilus]|uniref:LysR family transcriptional regulator n=1 Tax=Lentibacillus saliphilus TaxID=2737028 RepID=UPI001C302255|nr:LysR family transcriptional regulator [Lentibacillus saliphilus]
MKIDDYYLLLKLNEVGTIRGTAKAILISQPAVTQRLKWIEAYFDEMIFIRTQKKLQPTPAGELILQHAKEVVQREQMLEAKLSQSREKIQGTLSIACSSLVSQRFLPAILGEFTVQYPKVTIDLVTGISEDIKRNYRDYHVCMIRGEPLKETTCQHLFADKLYIFDTEPFPDEGIKERPLISFNSDDSMHDLVDDWLYRYGHNIKPQRMITVDQIETCKQLMKQGIGMAVLPESVSADMMDDYPHMPLMLNGENVTRDTWVCYHEGVVQLPQVDAFISALHNHVFSH